MFARDLLEQTLISSSHLLRLFSQASANCAIVLTSPVQQTSTNLSQFYISIISERCLKRCGPKKSCKIKSFSSSEFQALDLLVCLIVFFHILINFHFLNCLKKSNSLIWLYESRSISHCPREMNSTGVSFSQRVRPFPESVQYLGMQRLSYEIT